MRNFSVIKFKNGDVIFCEVDLVEDSPKFITVTEPYMAKTFSTENGTEVLHAAKWIPFTSNGKFTIPLDSILVLAPLNTTYKGFYGITQLKASLHELYINAVTKITKGEDKDHVLAGLLSQIEMTHSYIVSKFGKIDFDLEEFKDHIVGQLSVMSSDDEAYIEEPLQKILH